MWEALKDLYYADDKYNLDKNWSTAYVIVFKRLKLWIEGTED